MADNGTSAAPEFREWSIAAVQLLRGVVYADEERLWSMVLTSQSQLESYFARLGLLVVVDEPEGFAYLKQMADEELPSGYEELPKLIRRTKLGYDATMLCIVLREELRRFEEEEVHNERCVVETSLLFEQWKTLFPPQYDEVRHLRELSAALRKLDELGFIKKFSDEPESWEVRRIIKARLPAAELEALKVQLLGIVGKRRQESSSEANE
jgi:hypothetical protein